MRFITVASIACIVAGAAAFEFPDFVPLHRRQAPGTPQYECHANCGGIITASRSDGFCDSSDFESMLSDCLDCALVYDIWRYYGNSVSAAAEECGLDATPVEPTSTATETEPTSTATETSTEETTSASEEASSTATNSSTSVSSTPVIPTVTTTTTPTPPGSSTATPSPSDPEFTGGAALTSPAGPFMVGLIGSVLAALM